MIAIPTNAPQTRGRPRSDVFVPSPRGLRIVVLVSRRQEVRPNVPTVHDSNPGAAPLGLDDATPADVGSELFREVDAVWTAVVA
jgi:hypothetical protein